MSQIVEVPGQGNVEFPDGMSDQDIGRVVRLHISEPDAKGSPEWASWRNQRVHDLNDAAISPNKPDDTSMFKMLWDKVNPFPMLAGKNPDPGSVPNPVASGPRALGGGEHSGQYGGPLQGAENLVVNVGNAMADQGHKAASAYKQGDYVSAAGHGVAAALPVLGPMAANFGEHAGTAAGSYLGGNPDPQATKQAITDAAAAALTFGGPKIARGAVGAVDAVAPGLRPGVETWLRTNAENQYGRVLKPTTNANKLRTAEVVPDLIDQGIMAPTLKDLQSRAQGEISRVGQAIGDAWQNLPAGTATEFQPIYDRLQGEIDKTHSVPDSSGKLIPKGPEAERAIGNITKLQQTLTDVSETDPQTGKLMLPVDKARNLRQYFDDVAQKAGRYDGQNLATQSTAEAHGIAADSIRNELGKDHPDIAALNKEYSFWKDVNQVTTDTLLRKQGQAPSLGARAAQVAGFAKGGPLGAAAMKALADATSSPAWGTVAAVLKDRLADAIAKGNTGPAEFYVSKIAAAVNAAQLPTTAAAPR